MKKITKIVITGGPCGGKSTAMEHIREVFTKKGYTVLFIAETATELITGGVAPWTCGSNGLYQMCQMKLQLEKERVYDKAAATMVSEKILIVCDRGLMDNHAYMTEEEYAAALEYAGITEREGLEGYGAVFHLVTAADGAEKFYTTANNSARRETVEEAIKLDRKTIKVWETHPVHKIIDNSTDFKGKMERLILEISEFLGEN